MKPQCFSGDDTVWGGAGADALYGQTGNDYIYCEDGNDVLQGQEGNDYLRGGNGNDKLYGGAGNDSMGGDAGDDTLFGGAGKDVFVFDTALNKTTNVDVITDFKHGEDKIQLKKTGIFAKLAAGTLQSANFRANGTGKAQDSNDYILYNTTSGALLYDATGSGSGAAVHFATLQNKPQNITASDFVVVA